MRNLHYFILIFISPNSLTKPKPSCICFLFCFFFVFVFSNFNLPRAAAAQKLQLNIPREEDLLALKSMPSGKG